mgnify:FL=1
MSVEHHPRQRSMTEKGFLEYVTTVRWRFAKSVPNWPHFYIVEEELEDQLGYAATRAFIRDHGYDGNFFDMNVRYCDADGWTYWASPLAEPFESRYMLNRCRTEYTWDVLSKAGKLPPEGFQAQHLSLSPVLEDPEFQSLVRDRDAEDHASVDSEAPNAEMAERQRNVLHRHGKTFHCLPHLLELDEQSIREQCLDEELKQLQSLLPAAHDLSLLLSGR